MKTTATKSTLPDVLIIDIEPLYDDRGFFVESWNKKTFEELGVDATFVQENHSRSKKGTLRGLHYQDMTAPMAKLVRCTVGSVFDVAVDLRIGSSTFGKWVGIELSAENKRQVYIPIGFAHGFVALTEGAEVQYKQTSYYTPSSEGAIVWNDPELNITWPIETPLLSPKDSQAETLAEYKLNPAFQ